MELPNRQQGIRYREDFPRMLLSSAWRRAPTDKLALDIQPLLVKSRG